MRGRLHPHSNHVFFSIRFSFTSRQILGVSLSVGLIITHLVANAVITIQHHLNLSSPNAQDLTYDKPWTRCGPYGMGLLVAFMLVDYGPSIKKMGHTIGTLMLWLGVGLFICSIYVSSSFRWEHPDRHSWSAAGNMLYGMFIRLSWTLAVAMITLATYAGHGSFIGWILTQPFWEAFGRLTFAAYLFHPGFIRAIYYQRIYLFSVSYMETVVNYFGFLTISYLVAVVLFVFVEMPAANLTDFLTKGRK